MNVAGSEGNENPRPVAERVVGVRVVENTGCIGKRQGTIAWIDVLMYVLGIVADV